MKLVFIPGDGVGNEISSELIKICQALEDYTNLKFNIQTFDLGLNHYLETGIFVPDGVIKECEHAKAIWIGPLTDKSADGTPVKGAIMQRLISGLDTSIYCRRIRPFNPNINLMTTAPFDVFIIQDCINHETGTKSFTTAIRKGDGLTVDLSFTAHNRVHRLMEFAMNLIENGIRHSLTIALPEEQITSDNPWIKEYQNISSERDLPISIIAIDRVFFRLLHKPGDLDLVLTIAPYGKLLSKLGAAIEGGLGLAYESYMNESGQQLFHGLHPTSDNYIGKDAANPIGAIRALANILNHINRPGLGSAIDQAVASSLEAGWSTRDMGGSMGTSEIGDFICNKLSELIT